MPLACLAIKPANSMRIQIRTDSGVRYVDNLLAQPG